MIQSARRIENYHYAIRHLAGAAEALTRAGREVIYLNIGDPQVYGFRPPEHIVEPVIRALKNSFTGYTHSAGLGEAREAVAGYATRLGASTGPDQVLITSGASEAADILLTALLNENDEVLLPTPGYPIYPAILSKLGAAARYYHLDPTNAWQPSLETRCATLSRQFIASPAGGSVRPRPHNTQCGRHSKAIEHSRWILSANSEGDATLRSNVSKRSKAYHVTCRRQLST